jgi:membrane fusion protein (multidrug efflux system)
MRRAICFAFLIFLAGCTKEKLPNEAAEEPITPVSVFQVKAETVSKTLRLHGEIEAADYVAVFSKVSGKLLDYTVKRGEEIKKGDLIAHVDRDEVGFQYNQAPVYSPISGIVSSLPLHHGSEVTSATPIGTIMNAETVKAVFNLPERYRSHVKVGQSVTLVMNGETMSACVSEINPLIDPLSHSFKIEARLENREKKIIPGMFAAGELVLETFEKSILVPEEAILPVNGEWFIYTMASGQAFLKKVKLGLRKEGRVQVLSGVELGDLVIVGGNHKVSDGQKVRGL